MLIHVLKFITFFQFLSDYQYYKPSTTTSTDQGINSNNACTGIVYYICLIFKLTDIDNLKLWLLSCYVFHFFMYYQISYNVYIIISRWMVEIYMYCIIINTIVF